LDHGAGHGVVLRKGPSFLDLLLHRVPYVNSKDTDDLDDWRIDLRWSELSYTRLNDAVDGSSLTAVLQEDLPRGLFLFC